MPKVLSPRTDNREFDVRAYGATGAGSVNEAAAFQAAITAAGTASSTDGGATVIVPPGQYKISTTLITTGNNISIRAHGAYIFSGANVDILRNYTSQDSSYTLNGSGLTIEGGIWDCKGQNAALASDGYSAFTFSNSSDITMRDVTIRNVYNYHAVDLNTIDGAVFDSCRYEGFKNNFSWHTEVRVATTANGTLATSFENGDTIDGVVLATGNRILLKNQSTASQNGVYTVNASGAPTRATDMDASAEFNSAAVAVTAGTTNAGTSWHTTAVNPTVGTTSITWVQNTGFNVNNRYFSEAVQIDEGPNGIPCKNVNMTNCYMGPAVDGSGLLSFGKLVGTHTDSPSVLYSNIQILGNRVVNSLSNAIQGYSWADAIVSNNIINGSDERGVRMFFGSSNNGPRLNISNNMISQCVLNSILVDGGAGQVFGDCMITNNTITSTAMTGANAAIRVDVMERYQISNNQINMTGSSGGEQGIFIQTCLDGVVSGNNIQGSPTQGIQLNASSRHNVVGNRIYNVGREGIWLSGTANQNLVGNNFILGAGRATNNTYGCITISNANPANTDNSIIGNKFNKFGDAGNEALTPIVIAGTNPVDTFIEGNTFGGDWGGAGLGNYTWNNNATVGLGDSQFTARATSTTAIGTTITAIAGLSLTNVPAGTWVVEAVLPAVTVGSPTAMTMTISPASGPSTSSIRLNARAVRTGASPGTADVTAFNSAASLGALTAVATTFEVRGTFISTNTGTISISMTRTGGTSCTVQIGAYIMLRRVA